MAHEPAAKGRRRAARILAWTGIVLLGLPVLLLVLVSTPPVTRLVVRKLLPKVNEQLNGRLTVNEIGGSLLTRLDLRGVTLRDPIASGICCIPRSRSNRCNSSGRSCGC